MVTRAAWAKEEEGYLPLHVCVRPPYLNMRVVLWSYYANTTDFIYTLPADYLTKRYKYPTYLYDPEAPPENTKQLPREEDRKRPCDPKSPPPAPPPKEPPKEEAPKQGGSGSGGSGGQDPARERKKEAPRAPRAPSDEAPPRAPEGEPQRHPRLPEHGVTTDWPRSVLPTREAESKRSVLPTKRRDDRCAWELPWPGQKPIDRAQVCPGNGDGNGDGTKAGVKKTWVDKAAENLAYAAGGINLQFDEDLKRPDGKQYGVMGGRNSEGPNNPFMQAAASGVMIAAAVLSPKAEKLFKRLSAGKKGAPLLMKEMEDVGLGVADELATKLGQKAQAEALQEGEKLAASAAQAKVREALAKTLADNGAIGPYEVMKQFTAGLRGSYQAHHILEAQWAKKFPLGNPDKFPSVILTEAQHKEFTAKLAAKTSEIGNDAKKLWEAYQDVYKAHFTWLKAIKPYFKGK